MSAADLGLLLPDELALRPDTELTPVPSITVFEAQVVEAVTRKVALVMHDNALNRSLSLRGLLDASLAPLQTRNLPLPAASQALSREQRARVDPHALT